MSRSTSVRELRQISRNISRVSDGPWPRKEAYGSAVLPQLSSMDAKLRRKHVCCAYGSAASPKRVITSRRASSSLSACAAHSELSDAMATSTTLTTLPSRHEVEAWRSDDGSTTLPAASTAVMASGSTDLPPRARVRRRWRRCDDDTWAGATSSPTYAPA